MTSDRHPVRRYVLGFVATVLVLILAGVAIVAVRSGVDEAASKRRQSSLAGFYLPPDGWQETAPGTVLRQEPVQGVPAGGRGWRILYRTERSDGSPAVSGGLVFAPSGPAPPEGRPVVAWAHPTVGMGDGCAPSRAADVESGIPGLGLFLGEGWVITATDYAGLGTDGVEQYLVGDAEARDVLNSVRAARSLNDLDVGRRVMLWGHSQGGHAALFAGAEAAKIAPELKILGVATAAPAVELPALFRRQWNSLIGSLIGAEVLVAWPATYSGVTAAQVSGSSPEQIQRIADSCIPRAALELELRGFFGGRPLFRVDPTSASSWEEVSLGNTPAPPAPDLPVLIVQGLEDPVVLPGSTAGFVEHACTAGSDVTAVWVGDMGHVKAGFAAAPDVFTWFQERLAGRPSGTTCGTKPPVKPFHVDTARP